MEMQQAPTQTIEVLDCRAIFDHLVAHGPTNYAITHEQGRAFNTWVRTHTKHGCSQRQILDRGTVVGYVLSVTNSVKKRGGQK